MASNVSSHEAAVGRNHAPLESTARRGIAGAGLEAEAPQFWGGARPLGPLASLPEVVWALWTRAARAASPSDMGAGFSGGVDSRPSSFTSETTSWTGSAAI